MKKIKKKIFTNKSPLPIGPYNQAFKIDNYVFISGQIPIDSKTGTIPKGIQDQTILVLTNIHLILEAAELKIKNIIKTTVFLTNLNEMKEMNNVYKNFFIKHESEFPARSCIEVSRLPKDVKIEIEAIAIK